MSSLTIQYIEKSIPHAKDAGPSIRFKFKHEYLSVVYDEQQVFEEWEVTPYVKSPFQVKFEKCLCMLCNMIISFFSDTQRKCGYVWAEKRT